MKTNGLKAIKKPINFSSNVLDIREIVGRFQFLDSEFEKVINSDTSYDDWTDEKEEEFTVIQKVLDDIRGCDYEWNGNIYPLTFVHEKHFQKYIEATVSENLPSLISVDWKKTAENQKRDYFEVEIGGSVYFFK